MNVPGADAYKLSEPVFRGHLDAIEKSGSPTITRIAGSADWSGGLPVFLTFDDGGVSAHSCIAECLEERGWRGHFFVVTDLIGQPGFLTAQQIRDLDTRGHILGTHTASHPFGISRWPTTKIADEYKKSAERLSDVIGRAVKTGSVPGGFYSANVAQGAAEAGLEVLFTSEPTVRVRTVDGCWVLGRYHVTSTMPASFSGQIVSGAGTARLRQTLTWSAKKIAKAAFGDAYLNFRGLGRARS